jgi:RHS repeat-associated protein
LDYNGNYNNNFPSSNDLFFEFSYDKSNRLLSANCTNYSGKAFDVDNTYDKDGNILMLKRYKYDGVIKDDFSYTYYPGTNKLKKVSNQYQDYTYDNNANLKSDDLNKNFEIKYDHRNLITFIKHLVYGMEGEVYTRAIYYYYDEAGNRIRKIILQSYIIEPEEVMLDNIQQYPEYDEEIFNSEAKSYLKEELDNPTMWFLVSNEFYLRGIDGKELALFKGTNIERYNIGGRDNEGYLKTDDTKYYYIKDHLGSIRVILDQNINIVSAQDYDMWGSLMEGRSFDSYKGKYKFTGKERDTESNYDYFGVRYYDSRIGRWGSEEPLLDKYRNMTPFNYSKNNPLVYVDPDGKDPYRKYLGSFNEVLNIIQENVGKSYWELSNTFEKSDYRYIYTEKEGFIDLRHFFAAAHISKTISFNDALIFGEGIEFGQGAFGNQSVDRPEDRPSNLQGAKFGKEFKYTKNVYENFKEFIEQQTPLDPSDPKIAQDKIYIPYDEQGKPLPPRKSYDAYRGESPNYNRRNIIE